MCGTEQQHLDFTKLIITTLVDCDSEVEKATDEIMKVKGYHSDLRDGLLKVVKSHKETEHFKLYFELLALDLVLLLNG